MTEDNAKEIYKKRKEKDIQISHSTFTIRELL
jgi:hypothetical protein